MTRIVLTHKIPEAGMRLLEPLRPGPTVTADTEGILCLLLFRVDRAVLDAAPKLKVVSNMAVGYDNIDIAACKERGVIVCNTPGVLTETTADLAWALILSAARRIAEGDRFVRAGKFTVWDVNLLLGMDVHGKTLGIVGAGGIGQAVGRRATGFGMRILYTSRTRKVLFEQQTGAQCVQLEALLRESDFVVVTCALNKETHHLLNADRLRRMKPTAVLVNVARGPIIDEAALTRALQRKEIFAAGLDVYELEPKLTEGLQELDNVVLLPHIGSASVETRNKMAELAARNLINVLEGREPLHRVV